MKAVVAQFLFESNTFNPVPAELSLFTQGGTWLTDPAAIRNWSRSAPGQVSGSLEVLEEQGWTPCPVFVAVCGSPAGRLSRSAFEAIRNELLRTVAEALPADGLILHLHGAACAVGEDDVEGALIESVRSELGYGGPLVVSLDLHANVTRRMLESVHAVTAYRTMPHTDFVQTGQRAARLLVSNRPDRMVVGVRMAALVPPTDTHHGHGHFSELLARARSLEGLPGIEEVSVFPVQPWLDLDELGSSVVVTGTDPDRMAGEALRMASDWFEQRASWVSGIQSWDRIAEKLLEPRRPGWILVDSADATTGGSDGHSAEALRRLLPLADRMPGEILLWVVDPKSVRQAEAGLRSFSLGSPPVDWGAEAELMGDVSYRARGGVMTGTEFSLGRTVVLRNACLSVVVTTRATFGADPAFYEAVGLDPDRAHAVLVKSPMGWRAGFGASRNRGLIFDGPGQTSLEFSKLPFTKAGVGLHPLQERPESPVGLID
jgi:microcystin degradation protein MlrC